MDLDILSARTGYRRSTIKRQLKPAVFSKLDNKILSKYALVFEIDVEDLKTEKFNEDKF